MLSSLQFRIGSGPGEEPLRLPIEPSITIFVGPNNSGKSLALSEIRKGVNVGRLDGSSVISQVVVAPLTLDQANDYSASISSPAQLDELLPADHIVAVLQNGRNHLHLPRLIDVLTNPEVDRQYFGTYYASNYLLNLDGETRVSLCNPQERGDLKSPTLPFARLLTNNNRRRRLSNLVHEATGQHLVIDATVGSQLQIRFSDELPDDERSLSDSNLEFMRNARPLASVSDGVKAYSGILLQMLAGDPKIIFIDEPEAFLHPALARSLGTEIANAAVNEGKVVFASTHSPQFVMGAIESGARVNIVRLTYSQNVGTARLLQNENLRQLMNDPLLRSTGVLEAIFYNFVAVTEADADRAFYGEINNRLVSNGDRRGIRAVLFLNANGKDTVAQIVAPLRALGIPTASVVDLDVLKEGGVVWTRHLLGAGIPDGERAPYGQRRATVLASLRARAPNNFKTDGGVGVLAGAERETADNLLGDLARYGMFVVPVGEVEAWLPGLNVPRAKGRWLRKIFSAMANDPASPGYVRPGPSDVWDFIGQMRGWLSDINRRGIPN
ncbi:ATP-dependent endonuclease [Mesorhizobium sp. INR15]|uniref:ATP-dependent nuclease n=1 Tax=Mesorhizobium sp. INR15 TaxID=2654248 RepID=UPI0018964274|nr:AAA family ATPase [Mesorhizobium sp. INR15]QPC89716.1 AAA family ATPase [Mesorhizobium sp. INR15]